MTAVTSKRKKYVREMTPTWWKKLDFYKLYIAREATSLGALWFCIVLFYGVLNLGSLQEIGNFIQFLQNPIVVILNIIALATALLNTVTYYVMTPKVLNIVVKNERLNPNVITYGLWAVTIFISIVAIVLMYV